MIRGFVIELPADMFNNEENESATASEAHKKIGMLSVVDWCQRDIPAVNKTASLSTDKSRAITISTLLQMSNEQLLSYNELLWFSLDDLRKIFSTGRIKHATRHCDSHSIVRYLSLCQRFNPLSDNQKMVTDQKSVEQFINTSELSSDVTNYQLKPFEPMVKDLFIKESALYTVLSRLRKAKCRPLPDQFLLWIYDSVVPSIRLQTRVTISRLKLANRYPHSGDTPSAGGQRVQYDDDSTAITISDDETEVTVIGSSKNDGARSDQVLLDASVPAAGGNELVSDHFCLGQQPQSSKLVVSLIDAIFLMFFCFAPSS